MAITIIEGCKVYVNGTKSIIINSDYIDECMRVYSENHLDGVAITISHDYKIENVDFLSKYENIKRLSISDGISNINAIYTLRNLESLIISGKNRKIDFSYFPSLIELTADWSPHFTNMHECVNLKNLSLYGYNPKTKDCLSISNVPWIKKLKITQSPLYNLNGLDDFEQLEELEFNYCNKLESLCCLDKSKYTLNSLLFDHCKSIRNHEYVVKFSYLHTLAYNDSGIIKSIDFIKNMISLKSFRFIGTDITDGDITPCLGLRYASFSNKRNFSHTMQQIQRLLRD